MNNDDDILRSALNLSPENSGGEALILRRLDHLGTVMGLKFSEHGQKLDELRADMKGQRIDLRNDIGNLGARVEKLESQATRAEGAIGAVKLLFGTSIGALILAGYEFLKGRQ